ncbi:NAD(P)/FAD-dependent oxidoreductase [Protaetiibacter larvae]|uniref:NAD(P)/FAD-dependent oxidoreductase n=1 Tax=Protaetiibacter larvae TaxID=2592654 RepID=A0A5C1YA30_9MICO|nr:NAD(P)/FAD-dependent oxidoreductase [Protaetiibacter larvae]QEO10676.1 NAD(P)/FAD-dependent oxidoreductase [Protaetiibacter larvae]
MTVRVDVAVIGAGPAGLAAALGIVRARRSVIVLDSARPRNAATLASHGFITRDGISPLELRKLGAEELAGYGVAVERTVVTSLSPLESGEFVVQAETRGAGVGTEVVARAVVLATGLAETLPALPTLRAFYGTALHSCVDCDGWEKRTAPLALIGETDDLAERARFLANWSDDLVVFTNGVAEVSDADEAELASRGIRVERRVIADIAGTGREGMTGVTLADGETVPRTAGFVRPVWTPSLAFADDLGLARDADGYISTDGAGRTSVAGIYAAGDIVSGPQQLLIAAGDGARVAGSVIRDTLETTARVRRAPARAVE